MWVLADFVAEGDDRSFQLALVLEFATRHPAS
jgi:hypothetical protein